MKITNFKFIKTELKDLMVLPNTYDEFFGYATFLYRKYPWNHYYETKAILKGLPMCCQPSRTSNVPVAGDWFSCVTLELLPYSYRKKLDESFVFFVSQHTKNNIKSDLVDYINKINKV